MSISPISAPTAHSSTNPFPPQVMQSFYRTPRQRLFDPNAKSKKIPSATRNPTDSTTSKTQIVHRKAPFENLSNSAMHTAIKNKDHARVRHYLEQAIPFNMIEGDKSYFTLAIKNFSFDKDLIKQFVERSTPEIINHTTTTNALIEAAKALDAELVQYLLEQSADPNLSGSLELTPLLAAIRFGCFRAKAIDDLSIEKLTTLIHGHGKQLFKVLKILLTHGASVNFRGGYNSGPIHLLLNTFYLKEVDPYVLTLLVAFGADPSEIPWSEIESETSTEFMSRLQDAVTEGLRNYTHNLSLYLPNSNLSIQKLALNADLDWPERDQPERGLLSQSSV